MPPKKSSAVAKKKPLPIKPAAKAKTAKQLPPPYARHWLWLGWAALAIGGLYAVVLAGARSPKVQDMLPFAEVFKTSLIVHVDLTVLVWLVSAISLMWSLGASRKWALWRGAAFWISAMGAALIAIAPFTGDPQPLLNNYVPVLLQHTFLLGLILFFCGLSIQTLIALADSPENGLRQVAMILAISLACLFLSGHELANAKLAPLDYYEHLFWGSGHVLQIAYTLGCIVAWRMLAAHIGLRVTIPDAVLGISVIVALTSFLAYGAWPVLSAEHLTFFTEQMRWGGGLSAILAILLLTYGFLRTKRTTAGPVRNALYASFLLFASGGVIGFLISGANVTIPAHYHGSIVGISIAMMGMVYMVMPKLGYGVVQGRLARIQPWVYGGGQLLHIIGLAVSGGYGALRKTPGAVASPEGQAMMGLMGLGAGLSLLGGLLFVVVVLRAARKKS